MEVENTSINNKITLNNDLLNDLYLTYNEITEKYGPMVDAYYWEGAVYTKYKNGVASYHYKDHDDNPNFDIKNLDTIKIAPYSKVISVNCSAADLFVNMPNNMHIDKLKELLERSDIEYGMDDSSYYGDSVIFIEDYNGFQITIGCSNEGIIFPNSTIFFSRHLIKATKENPILNINSSFSDVDGSDTEITTNNSQLVPINDYQLIMVNGNFLTYENPIDDDNEFLSLDILNELDLDIDVNIDTIVIENDFYKLLYTLGSNQVVLNSTTYELDFTPYKSGNNIYIPLKFTLDKLELSYGYETELLDSYKNLDFYWIEHYSSYGYMSDESAIDCVKNALTEEFKHYEDMASDGRLDNTPFSQYKAQYSDSPLDFFYEIIDSSYCDGHIGRYSVIRNYEYSHFEDRMIQSRLPDFLVDRFDGDVYFILGIGDNGVALYKYPNQDLDPFLFFFAG